MVDLYLFVQRDVQTWPFPPKNRSKFHFVSTELQPVDLLPSMALVHLLVHAGWWGQLAALGWVKDRRDRITVVLSQ